MLLSKDDINNYCGHEPQIFFDGSLPQYDTEYQVRIKALEDRNQSQKEELEHVIEVHKHNNMISLVLAIVAIIAAVAIGFIASQWSRINYSKTVDQSAMVQEFRDQIHQAESSSGQTTYVVPDTNVADGN